jgi:hypothetical protein
MVVDRGYEDFLELRQREVRRNREIRSSTSENSVMAKFVEFLFFHALQ